MKQTNKSSGLEILGMQSVLPGLDAAINELAALRQRYVTQLDYIRNGGIQVQAEQAVAQLEGSVIDVQPEEPAPVVKKKKRRMTPAMKRQMSAAAAHARAALAAKRAAAKQSVPTGWLTTDQVGQKLGMTLHSAREFGKRKGWAFKRMPNPKGGPPVVLFKEANVEREAQRRQASVPEVQLVNGKEVEA